MSKQEDEIPQIDPNQPHPADVIQALNAENVDLKDRLLRALAETENVRRRGARGRAHLPRGVRAAADPQVRSVIEGVEATERQLMSTLANHGVKQVETEG